ncbi:MAG: UvrB/UvrC motif-containing protein [Pirellulales bacterium]|nr:UvrB/UvrC motif-containing protein [Pirellulales bacterium]
MPDPQDIDFLLNEWPFQPGTISARLIRAGDGREVMQMRIEMGALQMETAGRPDGQHPGGFETYLDYLHSLLLHRGEGFALSEEQCLEIDREFVQFYHRRICCLALREFRRAVDDADHTLGLMDFVAHWSPDRNYTASHEQHRPFVMFHRVQAAALAAMQETGPEAAIEEINGGLEQLRQLYVKLEAEEQFDGDELVDQLVQMKESLREEYQVGKTLNEQLADAVSAEQYERAAKIRDEIARRQSGRH